MSTQWLRASGDAARPRRVRGVGRARERVCSVGLAAQESRDVEKVLLARGRGDAVGGIERAEPRLRRRPPGLTRGPAGGSSRFIRRPALVTRSNRLGMRLLGLAG